MVLLFGREEGIRAFYRSYTTQLTMNIPFQVIIVPFLPREYTTTPRSRSNFCSEHISAPKALFSPEIVIDITYPLG
jgi:hypothetical protein